MKYQIRILFVCSVLFAVVCLGGCGKQPKIYLDTESYSASEESEAHTDPEQKEPEAAAAETAIEEADKTAGTEAASACVVYVCGEVVAPGVYTLSQGSRVCDALAAAGGLTGDASDSYWNQAQILTDGEMIYVPSVQEMESGQFQNPADAGTVAQNESFGTGSDGRINLNQATREELMTIPGIGESKADSIIAYRQEHGAFSKIEDVMNITGIKEGLFAKMKDYITIN